MVKKMASGAHLTILRRHPMAKSQLWLPLPTVTTETHDAQHCRLLRIRERMGQPFSKTFLELFHSFLSLFLSKTTGKVPLVSTLPITCPLGCCWLPRRRCGPSGILARRAVGVGWGGAAYVYLSAAQSANSHDNNS